VLRDSLDRHRSTRRQQRRHRRRERVAAAFNAALAFKAALNRSKDTIDFDAVTPRLDAE